MQARTARPTAQLAAVSAAYGGLAVAGTLPASDPAEESYELRKAGARQALIASSRRRVLLTEHHTHCELRLKEFVSALDLDAVNLVLVEDFRHLPFPRIELYRPSLGHPLLCREDGSIIAVASDAAPDCAGLSLLDINQAAEIAVFILDWQTGGSPRFS